MESTLKELEVISHSAFFVNAQDVFKNSKIRGYLEDLIFNSKTVFKHLDGQVMNNSDVLRMITYLSLLVESVPKEELSEAPEGFDNGNLETKNPLYLTEFLENTNNFYTKKLGNYFFNSASFENGIINVFLDTERFKGRRKFNISHLAKFKYTDLVKFKQPANYFILNDQYLGNLSESMLTANLFPLIENCTEVLESDSIRSVIILTKIKDDFRQSGKTKHDKFDEEYCIRNIESLNGKIAQYLPKNVQYKFIILKEYLLIADINKKVEDSSKLYSLKNSLKRLHDRFFISNYLIGESSNSFGYLHEKGRVLADCDLTLSSTMDIEYVFEFESSQKAIDDCISYANDIAFEKYFIKFER
jgi:hypothetical protein